FPILQVSETQRRVEPRVVADDLQTFAQQVHGAINRVLTPSPSLMTRAQIALICRKIVDRPFGQPLLFGGGESQLQSVDDQTCDALLDRENVLERAVECVGPKMLVVRRVDQLR